MQDLNDEHQEAAESETGASQVSEAEREGQKRVCCCRSGAGKNG